MGLVQLFSFYDTDIPGQIPENDIMFSAAGLHVRGHARLFLL